MGPTALSDALRSLEPPTDENLIVGFESSDDAAVYKVSADLAVITTVDFITPPVDDPYWFGQIAAANSLSDVYAMGGRPITALNLVMFPSGKLDMGMLKDILRGGHDKVVEAGASLAGGHTVDDLEPKYGLSVTGLIRPDKVIRNTGARPGDAIVITKPLGTGVLFNARRSGKLSDAAMREVLPIVASLNGPALGAALRHEVHALTDVTGFGILGHVFEMAACDNLLVELNYSALPFYPDALPMYRKGETTGSNRANRELVRNALELRTSLDSGQEELLFDPQTSGGLLIAVPASDADALVSDLKALGMDCSAVVGRVSQGEKPAIRVV